MVKMLKLKNLNLGFKDIIVLITMGILTNIVILFFGSFIFGKEKMLEQLIEMEKGTTNVYILIAFVALVVCTPLIEEFIFRGMMFNALKQKISIPSSVILCSLTFGIIHQKIMIIVVAFIMGNYFSYCYIKYESMYAPIIVHLAFNCTSFALGYLYIG